MKTNFKSIWIVIDRQGNPFLHTLNYTRKESIANFMGSSPETEWKSWQDAGWKCQKVDVDFEPV